MSSTDPLQNQIEDIALNFKPKETFHTKVVGTTFYTVGFDLLKANKQYVILQRQPNNEHDPNAIRVLAYYGEPIGWGQLGHLDRELAAQLAAGMDAGQIKVNVVDYEVTGGGEKHCGINLSLEVEHLDLRHLLSLNPFRKVGYERID